MTVSYELGNNLYLNITNRCTNRCEFCVRDNENGIDRDLDLWLDREPTVQEILADLKTRDLGKYDSVVFCGYGEPTIRLDVILAVGAWLKENTSLPVRLNTNGHANLIHKRDVTGELSKVLDTVSVSLNTDTAEKYERICHPAFGQGAYDGLLDFAKKCKEKGIDTLLSVVDVIPKEEIAHCREIAERVGVPLRVREYIE